MTMARKQTKVIALAASKGGVGKTTLSVALAVHAASMGQKIALLDRDPQESLADWYDRRIQEKGEAAGGLNLKLFEVDSTQEAIGLITAQGFDYLIIDTPPAMANLIEDAIAMADLVVVPSRVSGLDLRAVAPMIDLCTRLQRPLALVFNSVTKAQVTPKDIAGARQYLASEGVRVLETTVAQRKAYVAPMTTGLGPTEMARSEEAYAELSALWSEILSIVNTKAKGGKRNV